MHLPIRVAEGKERTVETEALLDSGAGGMFIDQNFAKENGLLMKPLTRPILARNVDGMPNKNGTITHYTTTDLLVGDQTMKTRFLVSGLGKEMIILGLPWLRQHNPDIDWEKGTFEFRTDPTLVRICAMMKGSPFEEQKV